VKPPPFTYHRPGSVDQTLHLLGTLGPDAKVLAGGQSLMPLLNLRLARPAHVVDINGLHDELGRIELVGEHLHIGPLVRQERLRTDPLVTNHAPLVAEAVRWIGHRAIRARGTLGGSLAHADPAAELPLVAVAIDSDIVVRGVGSERTIRAQDFFEGHFSTALGDDELLVEWRLPTLGERRWGFAELARRRGDFALVLVAAVLALDDDGVVTSCRIAAGAISSIPALLDEAGFVLVGRRPDRASVADTARAAAAACRPSSDVHASADYRKAMVEVLVRRALAEALNRGPAPAPASAHTAASAPTPSAPTPSAPTPRARGPLAPSLQVDGGTHSGEEPRRPPELLDVNGPVIVSLRVNGQPAAIAVPARRTLADAVRDELGLTGTHLGCEHGVCGACTVLLDDRPVRSCLMLAVQAEGREITTIEGVAPAGGRLHPVQEAFRTHHGLQCGFCTPAMVLATVDLLARIPHPSPGEVREELSGNICRCTGYMKVVESVLAAGRALEGRPPRPTP
jgi:CO/xanthine dehydrogenase FAD-binding subunit/aerobic-type carbon monoxide dehydrogenase small subunit (CoxS/CutS family)